MKKEDFYKKVLEQGFVSEGDSFDGCSNLDEGFSDYIEKIFHPWNLCRSFGYLHDSGAYQKCQLNSSIDILCYKTIRYIDIQGDTIVETERKLSQNKKEIDYYSKNKIAIFARYDYPNNYTKFLGVYKVNESLSKEHGFFVFAKTSDKLYISNTIENKCQDHD